MSNENFKLKSGEVMVDDGVITISEEVRLRLQREAEALLMESIQNADYMPLQMGKALLEAAGRQVEGAYDIAIEIKNAAVLAVQKDGSYEDLSDEDMRAWSIASGIPGTEGLLTAINIRAVSGAIAETDPEGASIFYAECRGGAAPDVARFLDEE